MRLAAAIGVLALTFAAALYIHEQRTVQPPKPSPRVAAELRKLSAAFLNDEKTLEKELPQVAFANYTQTFEPSQRAWADPVALLIALGGVAVAVGILTFRRTRFANLS